MSNYAADFEMIYPTEGAGMPNLITLLLVISVTKLDLCYLGGQSGKYELIKAYSISQNYYFSFTSIIQELVTHSLEY